MLQPGEDARQRVVHLTAKARALLPKIEAEWAATASAAAEMDAELPFPLAELVPAIAAALHRALVPPADHRVAVGARTPGVHRRAGRGGSPPVRLADQRRARSSAPALLTDITPLRDFAAVPAAVPGSLLSSSAAR